MKRFSCERESSDKHFERKFKKMSMGDFARVCRLSSFSRCHLDYDRLRVLARAPRPEVAAWRHRARRRRPRQVVLQRVVHGAESGRGLLLVLRLERRRDDDGEVQGG